MSKNNRVEIETIMQQVSAVRAELRSIEERLKALTIGLDGTDDQDPCDLREMSERSSIKDFVTTDSDDLTDFEVLKTQQSTSQDQKPSTTITELSSSISVIDYFRFCKELFAGKKDEMEHLLAHLSHMRDKSEVDDYLFRVMQWDRNDPVANSFYEIVAKHFR